MARSIPVVILLLTTLLGVGTSAVPFVGCPECPSETECLRCQGRGRITLVDSRRRVPLNPTLAAWLKHGGFWEMASIIAREQGRPASEVVGWHERPGFFYYSEITPVEGPEGPLALAVLTPKVRGSDDGSPTRILLYDRSGREMDRVDLSMPGVLSGLHGELVRGRDASILV